MTWEQKGNYSLWVYFLQEIWMQDLRAPIGVYHFHQLPALQLSCQISCNSPRLQNYCVEEGTGAKGGAHQSLAGARCGSVPSCCCQNRYCACSQHTCKGWALQHFWFGCEGEEIAESRQTNSGLVLSDMMQAENILPVLCGEGKWNIGHESIVSLELC